MQNEEVVLHALSEFASNYYLKLLKTRVFYAWRIFAESRGQMRLLYLTAYLQWRSYTLKFYLHLWHSTWKHRKHLLGAAKAHHRRRQLSKYFDFWIKQLQLKQHSEAGYTCASDKEDTSSVAPMNADFRPSPNDSIDRKYRLSTIFHHWLKLTRMNQELRWKHRLASAYHRRNLTQLCFCSWNECSRSSIAKMHFETALRRNCLRKWHQVAIEPMVKEPLLLVHQRRKVHIVFTSWYHYVKGTQIANHTLVEEFRSMFIQQRLRDTFNEWRTTSRLRSERRQEFAHLLHTAIESLRLIRLRAAFNCWKRSRIYSSKLHVATLFASQTLLRRCWIQWRAARSRFQEARTMKDMAVQFYFASLKLRFWARWCSEYRQARRLRQLGDLALCRWSLCLEARVWAAWNLYHKHRHTARVSASKVKTKSNESLLRISMQQWQTKATRAKIHRQHLLCELLWRNDFRVFRLAYKAFMRWFQWAMEKRNLPGDYNERSASFEPPGTLIHEQSSGVTEESGTDLNVVGKLTFHHNFKPSHPRYPTFMLPTLKEQGLLQDFTGSNEFSYTYSGGDAMLDYAPHNTNLQDFQKKINALAELVSIYRLKKRRIRILTFLRTDEHKIPSDHDTKKQSGRINVEHQRLKKDIKEIRTFVSRIIAELRNISVGET